MPPMKQSTSLTFSGLRFVLYALYLLRQSLLIRDSYSGMNFRDNNNNDDKNEYLQAAT